MRSLPGRNRHFGRGETCFATEGFFILIASFTLIVQFGCSSAESAALGRIFVSFRSFPIGMATLVGARHPWFHSDSPLALCPALFCWISPVLCCWIILREGIRRRHRVCTDFDRF